jgi:hypothetical protein
MCIYRYEHDEIGIIANGVLGIIFNVANVEKVIRQKTHGPCFGECMGREKSMKIGDKVISSIAFDVRV